MEPRLAAQTETSARPAFGAYREFAPCTALQPYVDAFFSFVPAGQHKPTDRSLLRETLFSAGDSFCSPLFADGNVSLVLGFGNACGTDGRWHSDPAGLTSEVIGPMTVVGSRSASEKPEMVGVYFRPARASPFLRMPITEIADRIVAIGDVWGGAAGATLPMDLCELDERARIDRLEAVLLERLARACDRATGVDVPGLTAGVLRCGGQVTVERLARLAGVSRQHLTRVFRDRVGVSPKTFSNLARFQSGLVYAGCGDAVDWARAAAALGYADQSHMIAEFRRFSSLTPHALAAEQPFHPFIARARARRAALTAGAGLGTPTAPLGRQLSTPPAT